MDTSPSLDQALDEAVSAMAHAIEVYHRSQLEPRTSPAEVRDALRNAMHCVLEASRLEFERRLADRRAASVAA